MLLTTWDDYSSIPGELDDGAGGGLAALNSSVPVGTSRPDVAVLPAVEPVRAWVDLEPVASSVGGCSSCGDVARPAVAYVDTAAPAGVDAIVPADVSVGVSVGTRDWLIVLALIVGGVWLWGYLR